MATRSASLVPLDFDGKRRELSCIYLSDEWSDLLEILADPCAFFAAKQVSWPQDLSQVADPKPLNFEWTLLRGCTVILEWIGSSIVSLQRLNAIAASFPEEHEFAKCQVSIDAFYDQTPVAYGNSEDGGPSKTPLEASIEAAWPNGVILAEFALETRTLIIRYHAIQTTAGLKRFKGELTNSSLIKVNNTATAGATVMVAASAHFDIGNDRLERARYVVDYLESPAKVLAAVFAFPGKEFKISDTTLVNLGQTITITPATKSNPPKVDDPQPKFPRVVIENVSPEMILRPQMGSKMKMLDGGGSGGMQNCLVCVEVNGVYTNPSGTSPDGVFLPDSTLVKCYDVIQPE